MTSDKIARLIDKREAEGKSTNALRLMYAKAKAKEIADEDYRQMRVPRPHPVA